MKETSTINFYKRHPEKAIAQLESGHYRGTTGTLEAEAAFVALKELHRYVYPDGDAEPVVPSGSYDKMTEPLVKPPLGLIPKDIHDLHRQLEIREAMMRYLDAGMDIPQEWVNEYRELMKAYAPSKYNYIKQREEIRNETTGDNTDRE